jgi:hypothetical protein
MLRHNRAYRAPTTSLSQLPADAAVFPSGGRARDDQGPAGLVEAAHTDESAGRRKVARCMASVLGVPPLTASAERRTPESDVS